MVAPRPMTFREYLAQQAAQQAQYAPGVAQPQPGQVEIQHVCVSDRQAARWISPSSGLAQRALP